MHAATTEHAQTTGTWARSAPPAAQLERSALRRLTREVGNRRFGQIAARARDREEILPSGAVHPGVASLLARAVSARASRLDGRALTEDPFAEIEGRRRPPVRALQRLTITQITPDSELRSGKCGERNVQWIFSLDKPAPEDGYIVQHIEGTEDIAGCPGPRSGTMTKTSDFWEAWFVNRGEIVEWQMRAGNFNFTDGSTRGPAPNKVGLQSSDGTVKFFGKSTTGDLGKDSVAPADPASTWGPGKVPTSGALPSTPTKPAWWDNTPIEGPAVRQARSEWNCCDPDEKKHTSRVTAYPPRPQRCEVKDWF